MNLRLRTQRGSRATLSHLASIRDLLSFNFMNERPPVGIIRGDPLGHVLPATSVIRRVRLASGRCHHGLRA